MSGTATLVRIKPDGVYTYVLDPPTEWEGVALHEIVIHVKRGSTCVYSGGERLQCRDRFGGGIIEPDEFLSAFCGYKETRLSRLRRLVDVIEPPIPSTITNYISYALKDEWFHLSEDAQLIITAVIQGADLAIANAQKRAEWREEDSDYYDEEEEPVLAELRAIRRLLEARSGIL